MRDRTGTGHGKREDSMLSDLLFLPWLQFVWVIAWHMLLPAFAVGLASYIAVFEGIYFATGREAQMLHSNDN
jgi:cytochrome bd ubiquinol oxidase subunit I